QLMDYVAWAAAAGGLDEALARVAGAAVTEYVEMFLGRHVYTRGADIREYRLLLLIRMHYETRLPTEEEISALFQTTTTQSRSLLRAVTSKFQYDLAPIADSALRAAVAAITDPGHGEDPHLDASSEYLVEALNRRIAARDPALDRLEKKSGTASRYLVRPSTVAALRDEFGL
ncbi:MAG TPA: hypothetical protein PKB03_04840, partial [Baekduia sp.]|nr:hypothetical protein [Baekduia sp.]